MTSNTDKLSKNLTMFASIATIIGVCVAIVALIPAFGQWLSPREPISQNQQVATSTPAVSVQNTATPISVLANPIPCSDMVLVGSADATIYKINIVSEKIIDRISLSSGQLGLLTWDSIHKVAYSADYNGDVISIIQPIPLSEIGVIKQDVGWNAYSIVASKDGQKMFAAFSKDSLRQVVEFDTATLSTLNKFVIANSFGDIYLALSSDSDYLYVSSDSDIESFATSDMSLISHDTIANAHNGRLAVSVDNRYLFIAQPGQLTKWNIETRRIESTISLSGVNESSWIEVSPDGKIVWIGGSNYGSPSNIIYEVSTSMDNFRTIEIDGAPYSFTQSSDSLCLYSTSFENGVTVTELSTNASRKIVSIQAVTGIIVLPVEKP